MRSLVRRFHGIGIHSLQKFSTTAQRKRSVLLAALIIGVMSMALQGSGPFIPNGVSFPNPNGASQTYSTHSGGINLTGPFFQSLGTNGRTCGTCHQPNNGMGVSAASVAQRFQFTQGMDPIFRTVDGSNCDHDVNVSTIAGRLQAYSLLRTRGLIRIPLAVPANADYQVASVNNPYGCNETDTISEYRRPLPTTNLRFLSTIMFDGRESSPATGTTKILFTNYPASLLSNLTHQAMDATNGHAQANPPLTISDPRLAPIVNFEMGLTTAQSSLRGIPLNGQGARGGPRALVNQLFFISINSSVDPLVPGFEPPGGTTAPGVGQSTPAIFNTFNAWSAFPAQDLRASVARGEAIFNSRPITISGVAGLNDDVSAGGLVAGGIPSFSGTCGTCHDTPNLGDHSFPTPVNIGVGDPDPSNATVSLGGLDISYLPTITVCKLDPATGLPTSTCKTTTDLGQGLIDGQFAHIGKMKGPILRGLSARAPYFHNGSARTLLDAVRFYETRFGLVLTQQDESDLVAFLSSL